MYTPESKEINTATLIILNVILLQISTIILLCYITGNVIHECNRILTLG